MFCLRKITTEYFGHEDRIRISGDVDGQNAVVIWLTQRLLQRLVPALLQHLGLREAAVNAEILQSFAQQSAVSELDHQAPVKASADCTAYLPTKVDIRKAGEFVCLEFASENNPSIILELGVVSLRQWLAILYDAYLRADWPLDVWPDWIGGQGGAAQSLETVQ